MGTIYIGRYKVIEELGRGGMGVVYRGEDPVLERPVAIKVLPPKKMNAKSIERFLREAKTSARLDNPYIVKIHDIGQVDDIRFIVMEYVEGSALSDLIDYEEIPTPEQLNTRLKIFRQVLEAVKYAHECGVIHRDLKPDNIMINKAGNVKIMDFGLAFFAGQHSLTEVGQVMGTAAYVSPEQAAGKMTDERTDIYSLGVILFELLTGRWPFEAQNPLEMFRKVAEMPAPSPKVFNKSVSLGLESFVLRALRKKPEDRFQNVGEMLESFDLCLRQGNKESNSGSFSAVEPNRLSVKTPTRLPAPSSARLATLSGNKTPERLPDPGELKRNSSASASPTPSSSSESKTESSAREELETTQMASATPSRYAPNRQTFTSGRSAVVGSSRRSNVRKGGAGVITIGGEAAFRTSVASYTQNEPVRVVVPPPGPAVKKAIEQTSVDVRIPEVSEKKESGPESVKDVKPEVSPNTGSSESNRAFVPRPMSFKSKPVAETPKPVANNANNEERHFVGGSGNGVASSSWMANVGEKEDLSKIAPAIAPEIEATEAERQVGDILENGLDFMANAKYKEAVGEFSLVLQREPQNVKALIALARAYMELNEYEKAQKNIEKSISLAPDSAESYVALADLYARTSDSSAVIATLHKALDRNEYDNALRSRLAFLYAQQHRYDVALEQYCLVLEQLPNDFVANFQLSLLLMEQNRLEEALPCAERAVQANPLDVDALGYLSYLYVQVGNVLKAQQLLSMSLESGIIANADFYTDLASISILQKRDNQAVVELSEALKLEPGHIETSSKLASLLCHHNQLNEAVKTLNQALKYHPNSLSLH
ncbi:protein kinase, partial [bacterium]|nr:protein kinase [bacterium]